MQVTPTAATTTGATNTTSGTTSTNNTLDYNNFLQLLVAQLQNQDPTNPSDPTQFVSQLASFSAVEQQVNTNSKLDSHAGSNDAYRGGGLYRPDGHFRGWQHLWADRFRASRLRGVDGEPCRRPDPRFELWGQNLIGGEKS